MEHNGAEHSRTERADVAPESTFVVPDHEVVLEAFADEMIAVHLGTGRYFSIDPTGGEILGLLGAGHAVGTIAEHLAARGDAAPDVVASAVAEFAGRLVDEGLVQPAPTRVPAAPLAPPTTGRPFAPPTIAVYSDMEDLLLLDPIHDVDETGWPVRADASNADPGGAPDAG